jgi:hypothetical protein
MAMPMDAAFAEYNTDRARTASSFLFGGTTYRGALTYWRGRDRPTAPRRADLGRVGQRGPQLRVGRVAAMSTRAMFPAGVPAG